MRLTIRTRNICQGRQIKKANSIYPKVDITGATVSQSPSMAHVTSPNLIMYITRPHTGDIAVDIIGKVGEKTPIDFLYRKSGRVLGYCRMTSRHQAKPCTLKERAS